MEKRGCNLELGTQVKQEWSPHLQSLRLQPIFSTVEEGRPKLPQATLHEHFIALIELDSAQEYEKEVSRGGNGGQ